MQTCSLCKARISGDGTVFFHYGKPGSLVNLEAKVCQFVKGKGGCINTNTKPISEEDGYGKVPPPIKIKV